MPGERPATNKDVEDSASAVSPDVQENKSKGKDAKSKPDGKGGGNRSRKSNTPQNKTESNSAKQTPGFAEGNQILNNYGLSVSGRKERILSPFKADKFFHFVEQSWQQLVRLKPHLTERFSLPEFRHASALQLYHRIESVKFDVLGIKPTAPVRIPLPRSTRVFQPIWSVLANVGYVDDNDLRVVYIPDSVLPKTEDLTDPDDIEGLLSCTLYDWHTSWNEVLEARQRRKSLQPRDGYSPDTMSNESPALTREELIKEIASHRRALRTAEENEKSGNFRLIDGFLYKLPTPQSSPTRESKEGKSSATQTVPSDDDLRKTKPFWSVEGAQRKLQALYDEARRAKQERITPRFDLSYRIEAYTVSDGEITADPGAYGARLHWDPQLWLEYEQFVEIVTPVAMFSLSMPAESVGTYAWVLPVEKRDDDDSSVSARMPKASIAPATWILSLLLQSSTLPFSQRSTFFVETDRLQNVLGLRQRYIRAAIKDPSAVEQYGTY
nr:MAG: coat protein [Ustilaginoidea virens partitivirus 4]